MPHTLRTPPLQAAVAIHRHKIERAIIRIRAGSTTRAACRAARLHGDAVEREVKRICDERGTSRVGIGGERCNSPQRIFRGPSM